MARIPTAESYTPGICPACKLARLLTPCTICPVCSWRRGDADREDEESLLNGEMTAVQFRLTEKYALARAWYLVVYAGAAKYHDGTPMTLAEYIGPEAELLTSEELEAMEGSWLS